MANQDQFRETIEEGYTFKGPSFVLGGAMLGEETLTGSLVRIPLWVGSTFTLLIPVFSALLAWVFFNEELLAIQAAAMAVVLGSLAIIVRGQSAAKNTALPAKQSTSS